jgi:hypothetical protein
MAGLQAMHWRFACLLACILPAADSIAPLGGAPPIQDIFTEKLVEPILVLLPIGVEAPATDPDIASNKNFTLQRAFKHFQYASIYTQLSSQIAKGEAQPLLNFVVLADPLAVLIQWEILPGDQMNDLIQLINYPTWLEMVPLAILQDDPVERFYLTLHLFGVSGLNGLLTGVRAEWSIYVAKPGDRPSFMIVLADHDELSLDPVNGFVPGNAMTHQSNESGIFSLVPVRPDDDAKNKTKKDDDDDAQTSNKKPPDDGVQVYFECSIPTAALDTAVSVLPTRQWIAANDQIYYRNGVSDRAFYNGNIFDVPVLSVDPSAITITDNSIFKDYIDPVPISVVVYTNQYELVVSPWFSIDAAGFA